MWMTGHIPLFDFFVLECGAGYRDDDSAELRPTAQVPPPATGQWEASNAASCRIPCIWRQSAWPQTQGPKRDNGDCVRLSAAINKRNAIKKKNLQTSFEYIEPSTIQIRPNVLFLLLYCYLPYHKEMIQ